MITVILVKNPFSPRDGREIKHIEFQGTLAELKEQHQITGVDLLSTVNGYSCEDKVLEDGDFVVLYPAIEKGGKGGKGILGIIAAIVLSVVAMGVGGLVATGVWGSFAGASALAATGGYLAAAAIMFLGSSLIGRTTGQKVDNGSYSEEATYSWTGVQTMEGQNNPIALTYGTVKSGGQTIGKYTMSSGDDEYLYWLVAAGEGEITFSDIRLNDNAITMYQGVSYQTRKGTNDQKIIDFFGDTHFTASLAYNMAKGTWYESGAQGTATEGLIFKIECPNGLFHTNDNGELQENYVAIKMQVRNVTAGSGWTDYKNFGGANMHGYDANLDAFVIRASSTKAIRREYRIDRLPASEYACRVMVSAIQHESVQRDGFRTYWTGISSIVYDDFCYPCTALIGIKARATDQLSGSPMLTFKKTKDVVYVWNPHQNKYQAKRANNPAWACYDIVHQCRDIKNINTSGNEYEVRGAPKELMRYDDFKAWADYCDEKNFYVNIEIVAAGETLDVCNDKIAPIGHGRVVRFGTKYGCIYAHPQEPVQMFGMGNILSGSFHEEFLKVADRANCVEVTFTNAKADYARDVLTIYSDTYDSDGYAKTAQVTMDGITSFSQAYREGVYQLQCNKLQLRTVTFEAGIDSIACTVGDVVIIAHDVPQWQFSGRVAGVNGNQIKLPCSVARIGAEEVLQWRDGETDTLHEHGCTVIASDGDYITVEMTYNEGETEIYPDVNEVFSIAESNTENKLFTVQSITRAQDFTRLITCIEYNEDVFEEPENYDSEHEHHGAKVVTIQQTPNQTITVVKFKGMVSIEYTSSFTEEGNGWSIRVNVESAPGYACGDLIINGFAYDSGAVLPLNTDYSIYATASAAGAVVYVNGATDHLYGWPDTKWFCMFSDYACTTRVNRKNLFGRLRCIDTVGNMRDGIAMFGANSDLTQGAADYCLNVTEIEQNVNTSMITRLIYCFNRCEYLQNVNVGGWDTGEVTDMSYMFCRCYRLLHIGNISHWDVAHVTTASYMFSMCNSIESIDLSGWSTQRLIYCNGMFEDCTVMEAVDISNWNTSNIAGVTNMFNRDYALKYIIMDATEVKFSGDVIFAEPNNTVKYIVPAGMVSIYQSHANWSARASRIVSKDNYNIMRSNGHVTVTERG